MQRRTVEVMRAHGLADVYTQDEYLALATSVLADGDDMHFQTLEGSVLASALAAIEMGKTIYEISRDWIYPIARSALTAGMGEYERIAAERGDTLLGMCVPAPSTPRDCQHDAFEEKAPSPKPLKAPTTPKMTVGTQLKIRVDTEALDDVRPEGVGMVASGEYEPYSSFESEYELPGPEDRPDFGDPPMSPGRLYDYYVNGTPESEESEEVAEPVDIAHAWHSAESGDSEEEEEGNPDWAGEYGEETEWEGDERDTRSSVFLTTQTEPGMYVGGTLASCEGDVEVVTEEVEICAAVRVFPCEIPVISGAHHPADDVEAYMTSYDGPLSGMMAVNAREADVEVEEEVEAPKRRFEPKREDDYVLDVAKLERRVKGVKDVLNTTFTTRRTAATVPKANPTLGVEVELFLSTDPNVLGAREASDTKYHRFTGSNARGSPVSFTVNFFRFAEEDVPEEIDLRYTLKNWRSTAGKDHIYVRIGLMLAQFLRQDDNVTFYIGHDRRNAVEGNSLSFAFEAMLFGFGVDYVYTGDSFAPSQFLPLGVVSGMEGKKTIRNLVVKTVSMNAIKKQHGGQVWNTVRPYGEGPLYLESSLPLLMEQMATKAKVVSDDERVHSLSANLREVSSSLSRAMNFIEAQGLKDAFDEGAPAKVKAKGEKEPTTAQAIAAAELNTRKLAKDAVL